MACSDDRQRAGEPDPALFTHRTGYVHPFGERSYFTRIAVRALSDAESLSVARAVLATSDVPTTLREATARRADGNPFFVEEIVKSHQEGATIVPEIVQGIITARIDRLADGPKRVLQTASVIGREFNRRLLDRVAEPGTPIEPSVRELMRLELILQKSIDPDETYLFRHALTHEVAYGSLLLSQRKHFHATIGAAIEAFYGDRLADHVDVIAHHFGQAEAWPKAVTYRLKAAEKAVATFATREAIALYNQAEEAIGHLGAGGAGGHSHRDASCPRGSLQPRQRLRPGAHRRRTSLASCARSRRPRRRR
jgi:predicted ATPase